MKEDRDFSFENDDALRIVQKYEEMLKQKKSPFFDVVDFESIIDFYLDTNNARQAAEAIDIACQIHPNSLEIQLKKIELLIIDEKYGQGLRLSNNLIKIDSQCSEAYFFKGQSHLGLAEYELAEFAFGKALAYASDNRFDLLVRIASTYQEILEYHAAIHYFNLAYNIDNLSIHVNFELGFCYECISNYELSIKHYNLCLDINPFSSTTWYNLGIVYTRIGDFDLAIDAYDYALAVDPTYSAAIHNKVNALITKEKYLEAIDELTELINYDPHNSTLYVSLGDCFERIEQYDMALAAYNKGIEVFSSCAEAYFGIGIVKLKTLQPHVALDYINKALAIEPENYDFWLGLARAKYEVNQVDDAMNAYRQATLLNPEEPDAFIGLAETLLYKEAFSEVVKLYNEILPRFNQIYPLKVICAAAMYLQNKPNKAIELLRGAKMIDSAAIDEFFSILPSVKDIHFMSKIKLL